MFQFQHIPPEDALPPDQVRFIDLHVELWPDGRRVRVHAEITPFQQRPTLDARILDAGEIEVASTTIIENMDLKLVFTMHLRGEHDSPYTLIASLSYPETGTVDERSVAFDPAVLPPPES